MKQCPTRYFIAFLLLAPTAGFRAAAQANDISLVKRTLANELREAANVQHPMRYRLRKSSPRLITTKEICETRDGAVARLLAINDGPLSRADESREQTRLDALLSDPGKQRHRKQAEDEDAARALKVLKALPDAFLFDSFPAGNEDSGQLRKFAFRPNPKFAPADLEAQVLTQMSGAIWIDTAQERVARLEGRLQQDVDFGWGILGRLNKGGSILIEQADVGDRTWRVVHFKMMMSGRVVFRSKVFDTTEDETDFRPVPPGMRYQDAIAVLRSSQLDFHQLDSHQTGSEKP